jgi:hypothetical protein
MAPGMRRRAMTRLARFVTGSTLPSVLTEVRLWSCSLLSLVLLMLANCT